MIRRFLRSSFSSSRLPRLSPMCSVAPRFSSNSQQQQQQQLEDTTVVPSLNSSPFLPPARESIAFNEFTHEAIAAEPRRAENRACLLVREFPKAKNIRNICISAHVDHGKTTLSDAILRRVGVLDNSRRVGTFTDRLQVERDRGITVKSVCCSFFIKVPPPPPTESKVEQEQGEEVSAVAPGTAAAAEGKEEVFLISLIDSPGHTDFGHEVVRSLAACEGAVLLVDASQGVQSQTVQNLYLAHEAGCTIVPALTKLDAVLSEDAVLSALDQTEQLTGLPSSQIIMTAARAKRGVEDLLREVVLRVPPPRNADASLPFRALLIDTWADVPDESHNQSQSHHQQQQHHGGRNSQKKERIALLVRIFEGCIKRRDVVALYFGRSTLQVLEVALLNPDPVETGEAIAGMVVVAYCERLQSEPHHNHQQQQQQQGTVVSGDTVFGVSSTSVTFRDNDPDVLAKFNAAMPPRSKVQPLEQLQEQKAMVFASFFPDQNDSITSLREAVERLRLNDPTVTVSQAKCTAFGDGLSVGCRGTLALEVFMQRLASEHDTAVICTPASVSYKYKNKKGEMLDLNAQNFVDRHEGAVAYYEPVVTCVIVTPHEFIGELTTRAMADFRGEVIDTQFVGGDDGDSSGSGSISRQRVTLKIKMPLAELCSGWLDTLKSVSHGFADLDYSNEKFEECDLVKLSFKVNQAKLDALSTLVVRSQSQALAKRIVKALKENMGRQIVDMPVQAMIGNKVIARETVGALKKDVLAKIHAGDASRKRRKLDHQKQGKAKIAKRMIGQAHIDEEAMLAVMGATRLRG